MRKLKKLFTAKAQTNDGAVLKPKRGGAHPQPPDIFPQSDKQADIYNRILGAIEPVEAKRDIATINRSGRLSDRVASSQIEPLSQRSSRGFERTVSSSILDTSRKSSSIALLDGEHVWTHDRQVLELAIQAEAAADQSNWNPDLQSEEQRLKQRLSKLALEMKVMVGDGNCQFRAISFGLYGSQDYHMSVRQKAVAYIREHKQEYASFLGEDIDAYLADMQEHATWGDELTLRAVSDHFGIVINVVTSDQQHWFMRYKPKTVKILLELFLTYIAPVHYNAIRRQTVTQALKQTLARQNTSAIEQAMKRALSAEKSLQSAQFTDQVREALHHGQKLEASTTETKGAPAPISVAKTAAAQQKAGLAEQMRPMSPVAEDAHEGLNGASPKRQNGGAANSSLNRTSAIMEDGTLNGAPPMEFGTPHAQDVDILDPSQHMPKSVFADHKQDGTFDTDRMSLDGVSRKAQSHPTSHRPQPVSLL